MPRRGVWPDDFWAKVDKRGPDECWPWIGRVERNGYGVAYVKRRNRGAHRVAYELEVEPIPAGLDIDHECHNRDPSCPGGPSCLHRRCCNPAHLSPKTRRQNLESSTVASSTVNKAKDECRWGHAFTPANTYVTKKGWRCCRECQRITSARVRAGIRPLRGPL